MKRRVIGMIQPDKLLPERASVLLLAAVAAPLAAQTPGDTVGVTIPGTDVHFAEVFVPAGTFALGSPPCRSGRDGGTEPLDGRAWFVDNSDEVTQEVGTAAPNAWGLHDLLGNAAEWTLDQYRADFYYHEGIYYRYDPGRDVYLVVEPPEGAA